ncbi:hypothetical protein C2S53_016764 [Perilla frutescens var. hirtella]|uniref:Uncharacterized protein n=1 Tax=Perilla frutescens var. hirtella TaxID=608512 RepID=A0AAD4PEQ6_PERFH|nr:hypothetical protein C2S53_016764 [Perilla frutescens var. hirtella]
MFSHTISSTMWQVASSEIEPELMNPIGSRVKKGSKLMRKSKNWIALEVLNCTRNGSTEKTEHGATALSPTTARPCSRRRHMCERAYARGRGLLISPAPAGAPHLAGARGVLFAYSDQSFPLSSVHSHSIFPSIHSLFI